MRQSLSIKDFPSIYYQAVNKQIKRICNLFYINKLLFIISQILIIKE